jgi:hypothetical protein
MCNSAISSPNYPSPQEHEQEKNETLTFQEPKRKYQTPHEERPHRPGSPSQGLQLALSTAG